MKRTLHCASAIVALASAASLSSAAITVTTIPPNAVTFPFGGPSNAGFTIRVNPGLDNVLVTVSAANEDINHIDVDTAGVNGSGVPLIANLTVDAKRIGSIRKTNFAQGELWLDQITTSENVGDRDFSTAIGNAPASSIIANRIANLSVGKELLCNLTIAGSVRSGAMGVAVESIHVRNRINGVLGPENRGFFGTINVQSGKVQQIIVDGDLGGGVLAGGMAGNIIANGDVDLIQARSANWVYIDMGLSSINGVLGRLNITHGDFVGFLRTKQIGQLGLHINGSLTGEVRVSLPSPPTSIWSIGKSLGDLNTFGGLNGGDGWIYLPYQGLTNQIIVNQQDSGGTWGAMGHITLAPPPLPAPQTPTNIVANYSQLPAEIGNGAAGSSPFRLHDQASSPPNFGTIFDGHVNPTDPIDPPPCTYSFKHAFLEYYGHVVLNGLESEIVTVQRTPINNPGNWTTLAHDWARAELAGPPGIARRIRVTPVIRVAGVPTYETTWPAGFVYRVRVNPGKVLCHGVAGTPSTGSATLEFSVYDGCEQLFDQNTDGAVNAYDIPAWLVTPTDIDTSGAANDRDFRALIHGVATWPNPQ